MSSTNMQKVLNEAKYSTARDCTLTAQTNFIRLDVDYWQTTVHYHIVQASVNNVKIFQNRL